MGRGGGRGGRKERRKFAAARAGVGETLTAGQMHLLVKLYHTFPPVSSQSDGGFSPPSRPPPPGSGDLFARINYRACAQTPFPSSLIRHINTVQADFHAGAIDPGKALSSGTQEQLMCGCAPDVFSAIKGGKASANVETVPPAPPDPSSR